MGKDTTTAADHPTTNSLASLPDDLLGPIPHEIRLGQSKLMILDAPPKRGDYLDVVVRLRVKGGGDEQPTPDGEVFYYKTTTLVAAWLKGSPEPPKPDDDEPPPAMLDEKGQIPDDDEDAAAGSGVENPGFSDAE